MIYYTKKKEALLRAQESGKRLANRNITQYFLIQNEAEFLDIIKSHDTKNFYEYIPENTPVPFFFDIEIYKNKSPYYDNYNEIIAKCIESIESICSQNSRIDVPIYKKIILESHSDEKRSFHLIVRIYDSTDTEILVSNVSELKRLHKTFGFHKLKDTTSKQFLIDPSVYRAKGGLFRTIYSSKTGENRPLVISDLSDPFNEVEAFVCYNNGNYTILDTVLQTLDSDIGTENANDNLEISDKKVVNIPEELTDEDKTIIKKFITKEFKQWPNKTREIFIDEQHNCIVIALNERYCPFIDREHKSNNQYIVIDTSSAKQKCHDPECNEHKFNEIKLDNYPKEIYQTIKKCLKVNQQELTLINNAIIECKNYITENFDNDVKDVSFDKTAMIFRGNVGNTMLTKLLKGKCPECNVEHQIGDTGYCLKCTKCLAIFPKQQIIPVDNRYKTLNSFWMNYNQLVNHGTINININNIINNSGPDTEFSCDITLDNKIFRNKELTTIANQVLDGHKITMISKLMYTITRNFVYSRNNWYYFTGSIWKADSDSIAMKKDIIIDLPKVFERVKLFYDEEFKEAKEERKEYLKKNILNNIKNLIIKFHKPSFQDDIIKGAKIYYNDENFVFNLNSKKHLVPFTNGVFDLLSNSFRKTKKEDYINMTMNYEFDTDANNPEVYTFIEQVLPNQGVRDYVLKKMSECLNGDIPNTYFLMFIGDSGANGKSQLLNLMKLTMGDFGEKVEVTLLTRKRNNANEANTEKIKLMNKRFAFLSEPEDGEKINIGLLKELTGSEEIVARGLYQEAMSFVMEAKLFLACNELPEIKGEDTALWRRIRVIDFPSRFVDEPKESNEYKIDRTLPARMREDVTWRQTFIKILLDYHNKNVAEPDEVKMKTNEYRQENNDFYTWLEENVEYKENDVMTLKEVTEVYLGKPIKKEREKSKYKKEIESFIKLRFKTVDYEYKKVRLHSEGTAYGWKHLKIKDDIQI